MSEASHSKTSSVALVLGAIGVVFGDIGTSPLYTLHECIGVHGVGTDREAVYGVLSLVCWGITLVVTIKYLAFLMRADNQGEGGIMALLALTPAKLRAPKPGHLGAMAVLVIIGAALLFGDGIITPAISVLSAVEGLQVATMRFQPFVVPITLVILVGLFAVQRQGTGGLGRLFGPVMVVWFATIGVLGALHVARDPAILAALSPHYAVRFFAHNGFAGFRVLGGVVLAVTGGEALYADMGHFGKQPIRAGWLMLVYPALLLCYLGQGANVIQHPEALQQPFYALVPPGPWLYPLVGLAALATVIASQALISGVFSLTHQAIRLGYFPRVEVRHTSNESEGQIYVPLLNWALAIACIALVLAFRESSRLAAAYGFAVSGTMVITSLVFAVVAHLHFGWSRLHAILVLAFFLSFDLPFFVANSLKFLDGGYLPFLVGVLFCVVMVVWYRGRSLLIEHFRRMAVPVPEFLQSLATRIVGRTPGTAVFLTSQLDGIPGSLTRIVEWFHVVYERSVLVAVQTEPRPVVPEDERYTFADVGPSIWRVVVKVGYHEQVDLPAILGVALPRIGCETPMSELRYVVGRESFAATAKGDMGALSESLYDLLSRNARRPTDDFGIAPEQLIELGMRIDL